jgi:hypothetical protein
MISEPMVTMSTGGQRSHDVTLRDRVKRRVLRRAATRGRTRTGGDRRAGNGLTFASTATLPASC